MVEKDPEGAIALVLEAAKLHDRPASKAAQVIGGLRGRILRNKDYRRQEGFDQLHRLAEDPKIDSLDAKVLRSFEHYPLHRLRWAQCNRKKLLTTDYAREEFNKIHFIDPVFADFKVPPAIMEAHSEYRQSLILKNHQHDHKEAAKYSYSEQEVDEMIQWAKDFCENDELDFTVRKNSLNMLEACCILTGRRKWELCNTLEMRSSYVSDYQAIVSGIAKDFSRQNLERPIPLLAPIATVAKGIVKLRKYKHVMGDYCQSMKSKRFPKLSHTMYRDIYCKRAWRDRAINQFMPQQCSEIYWCSQALCDTLNVFTSHYATAVIHHGEPGQPDHRDIQLQLEHKPNFHRQQAEVADSSSGSSDDVCEDSL